LGHIIIYLLINTARSNSTSLHILHNIIYKNIILWKHSVPMKGHSHLKKKKRYLLSIILDHLNDEVRSQSTCQNEAPSMDGSQVHSIHNHSEAQYFSKAGDLAALALAGLTFYLPMVRKLNIGLRVVSAMVPAYYMHSWGESTREQLLWNKCKSSIINDSLYCLSEVHGLPWKTSQNIRMISIIINNHIF